MSDYRDPRDPIQRDPAYGAFNSPAHDLRAQSYSPGMAAAWFVGIALFIGILIFAFGGNENPRVAESGPTPPAATGTQPAPAPATPPAQPPAQQ